MCLENNHQIQMMTDLLDHHQMSYTLVGNDDHIYQGINIYVGELVNRD